VEVQDGEVATVVGWGETEVNFNCFDNCMGSQIIYMYQPHSGDSAEVLMEGTLTVISDSSCNYYQELMDIFICAADYTGLTAPCGVSSESQPQLSEYIW
jgi:hypothetical protein